MRSEPTFNMEVHAMLLAVLLMMTYRVSSPQINCYLWAMSFNCLLLPVLAQFKPGRREFDHGPISHHDINENHTKYY